MPSNKVDSAVQSSGHAPRMQKTVIVKKIVIVKKSLKKRSWTNRQSTLISKYCTNHEKDCLFSSGGQRCRETRKDEYARWQKNKQSDRNTSQTCMKCEVEKISDQFYKDPTRAKGIDNVCKECKKSYYKQRHNTWEVLIKSQW